MSTQTIRETDNYAYLEDRLAGCGRFLRKSDNEVSPYDTGFDYEIRKLSFATLSDEQFDLVAKQQEYD